jgi:hypothetical protein
MPAELGKRENPGRGEHIKTKKGRTGMGQEINNGRERIQITTNKRKNRDGEEINHLKRENPWTGE